MESKFNAYLFPLRPLVLTYIGESQCTYNIATFVVPAKFCSMLGACNAVFDLCVAIPVSGFIIKMGISFTVERLMRCNAQYLLFVYLTD